MQSQLIQPRSHTACAVTNCHMRPGYPSFEGMKHIGLAERDVPNAVVKKSWQDLSAAASDCHCWFGIISLLNHTLMIVLRCYMRLWNAALTSVTIRHAQKCMIVVC